MQNFKSFLLKENYNPQNHDLSITLDCDTKIYTPELVEDYESAYDIEHEQNYIANKLSELMPNEKIDCYFSISPATLIASINIEKSNKNISLAFQNELAKNVEQNLHKIIDKDIIQNKVLTHFLTIREQLPEDIKIQGSIVKFNLGNAKPFKLTKLNKQLTSCKILEITHSEKIIGDVLSLLLIKDLHTIKCFENKKWLNIIQKHLETKDVLECQEELISNGLNEYAKL